MTPVLRNCVNLLRAFRTASLVCAWSLVMLSGWSWAVPTEDAAFTAQEFAFAGPDRIAEGWRSIRLTNQGRDLHQIQFLKLPENKTAEDFRAAIKADWSKMPSWVQRAGGVNSVTPGRDAVAVIRLEPGDYVVICGIPDVRGKPHVVHGMMRPLRVTPSVESANSPPAADVILTARDFSFAMDRVLKAGPQTVRLRNEGRQAHEVVFVHLTPGASVEDFLDAFMPGSPNNQAGLPLGGLVGIDPGRDGFFLVDLKPGRYGLLCFLPDPVTRAPHFANGMLLTVDVR
ncbi:MAG: hypothetical protein HY205_05510 [Nitrospirae bacterium]|nr:hypothetical protein [Nitrospirota bacterium]